MERKCNRAETEARCTGRKNREDRRTGRKLKDAAQTHRGQTDLTEPTHIRADCSCTAYQLYIYIAKAAMSF